MMDDKRKAQYIKKYEDGKNKRLEAVDFLFTNNLISTDERKTIITRIDAFHLSKLKQLED